jgi:hypothetical protein
VNETDEMKSAFSSTNDWTILKENLKTNTFWNWYFIFVKFWHILSDMLRIKRAFMGLMQKKFNIF